MYIIKTHLLWCVLYESATIIFHMNYTYRLVLQMYFSHINEESYKLTLNQKSRLSAITLEQYTLYD